MAVQPSERIADGTTVLADHNPHLIETPGCHCLGSAADHRHAIERRKQLGPTKATACTCGQDDRAPAGQRHRARGDQALA